jgi:hypothetical protein
LRSSPERTAAFCVFSDRSFLVSSVTPQAAIFVVFWGKSYP